jgi:hypothetical protein
MSKVVCYHYAAMLNKQFKDFPMKYARFLAVAWLLPSLAVAYGEESFTEIFDGKTLDGWEGNEKFFRVEDGSIVAGTLKERIPRNEFLCSKKEYGDFELELKFKLVGKGVNSGVQFRSKRIPGDHEVSGYQADLGDPGWWGSLYDESRRNKLLVKSDDAVIKKALKRDDWNDYKARCEGKRIQIWLNGVQTVDYTEPDEKIDEKGIIGVQIHSGPPSEAHFKEIRIKELGAKK